MKRLLIPILLFFLGSSTVHGQPKEQPKLLWGADKAGGAPFIFEQDGKLVGFEYELADYFAKEIGRQPELMQNNYDNLPDLLLRKGCDILLNGFEYVPSREKEFPSTLPYFVYSLRLIAHKDDASIRNWDDLRAKDGQSKKRVGVLRGSFSQRFMEQTFGDSIDLVPANEVGEMLQLVNGKQQMDATVQDSPAAKYYVELGDEFPKLHVIGEPRGLGYYVILTRPENAELRQQLNGAIRKAVTSGKLQEILKKYQLWDAQQERIVKAHSDPWPPETIEDDLNSTTRVSAHIQFSQLWGRLLTASGLTLGLACVSMPLAILAGILTAVGRMYGPWIVRFVLTVYVEVIRGTPLLLQMFVLFYLIPELARQTEIEWLITLTSPHPFIVGVIGLAINYSAYEAEIYRAGLMAIPRGQMEAALALGMTPAMAVRKVILPQAVRIVIPPVTNDFIALFKDTSVCSMITLTELTGFYYQNKFDRDILLQLALAVGIAYLLMSYPLSLLARAMEKRLTKEASK